MHTTSASLLERLREPGDQDANGAAWARFVDLYTPLLFCWARRLKLNHADAADVVQEVFAALVQAMPQFRYDRDRGFRNWLLTVLLNKWRDRCRRLTQVPAVGGQALLDDLAAPEESDAFGDAEYRQHLVHRALELMQVEFSPSMWKACWEHVVAGRPAGAVAAELGIAVGTVYVAKARILGRLREELAGLLE
jgi:RNA polymerase sigma-70 factor (ECF subfamily)